MGNVTGKMYLKTEGQNYAEGIVCGQSQLGTFQKINFKVTGYRGNVVTSPMTENAPSGQKNVTVGNGSQFKAGFSVYIKDDENSETNTISGVSGNLLTMYNNLQHNYYVSTHGMVIGSDSTIIAFSLFNVTKNITIDMDVYGSYNEKDVTENWIGDTVRAQPKGGLILDHVEFFINTYYT